MRRVPTEIGHDEQSATHFVSGISYGSNTFFVFDREVRRNENNANVISDMALLISFLPHLDEIPEMDKGEAKKLTCTVYGDTPLSGSSISFEEAVKIIGEESKNHESMIPVKVSLQPLSSLDIEGASCLTAVNLGTISQVQSIIGDLLDLKTRVTVLTKTKAFFNFSSIQTKLYKFKEMISHYINILKKDLARLLPRVRSGEAEEEELVKLLEEIAETPFRQAYLSSWVYKTEQEVNLLSVYLDYFKGIQFAFEPDELDSVINSLEYDKVVCFSFAFVESQDNHLRQMYTYLHTGKWNQEPPDENTWCKNEALINDFKTQARHFSRLAKTTDDAKAKFVVTNISGESNGGRIAFIQMFQDGQPTQFQADGTIPLQSLKASDNAALPVKSALRHPSNLGRPLRELDTQPEETTQMQHGASCDHPQRENNSTVFGAATSRETTKARPEPPKTKQMQHEPSFSEQVQNKWEEAHFKMSDSYANDNRKIGSNVTPPEEYHQSPQRPSMSSRIGAEKNPPSPRRSQTDQEVYRNASAKGTCVHEIYTTPSHEPLEATKPTLPESLYVHQVRKIFERGDETGITKSENDERKFMTKTNLPGMPETRRHDKENQSPSFWKSEIDEEDRGRENYTSLQLKGSSTEQTCDSSAGMLPTTNTGDTKKASSRLAERMRLMSTKIENSQKEYGSIYKLPTQETMRLDGEKMIVRKQLNSPFDGQQVFAHERLKEKVLLVMGATGAGKTTLINGMVNYILGVEWDDEFRFKLVTEEVITQAKSVTKEITAYTIHPMKGSNLPYVFTIVDTPGFGDTDGVSRDVKITGQIKDFFSLQPPEGIDHVDGVGFVTQSSLARLTPTQRYIFDSILSIFGKDVEKNFFMMVTFADGQDPPVLEAIEDAQISYESYFKFNNSALYAKNTNASFDQMFWLMGNASFQEFFLKFGTTNSVSLQLTNLVLKEREQLEALVEGLNPQITVGLAKMEQMRKEKQILERHESDIENNKDFETTVPKLVAKKTDLKGTGRHTTTCLACNYTCHKDCKISEDSQKNRCVAMNGDGNCKVCTGKCWWERHSNVPYLIEYKTINEKVTLKELKEKYDMAVSGRSRVENMLTKLQEEYHKLRVKVVTNMYEVRVCLHRLDEIALKPNPLTELDYIELLIENEKREGRPGFKDRVDAYEQLKGKAKMFHEIKHVDEIPKLVEKFLPLEETGRSRSSRKQKGSSLPACVLQ